MDNCVSRDVLEERGAGEVGWEEPHEQESDSTGKDKRVRAKESWRTQVNSRLARARDMPNNVRVTAARKTIV